MTGMDLELDSAWVAANPLPVHSRGTTKNSRGRVLAVGGARSVPGALRLTGEAALRAGAGKLQMATIEAAALLLGVAVPEAGVIALPEDADGEIAPAGDAIVLGAVGGCDTLVLGPGMGSAAVAARLVGAVAAAPREGVRMVLDAQAIACAGPMAEALRSYSGRMVFTPHHGEMAALCGCDAEEIGRHPARFACEVATRYGAVVVLKNDTTLIAAPDGMVLRYAGGGVGLATGGSGDVLAGAIGGLLSRGASPVVAAGWGVWLHGHAGRAAAVERGPIGFLARELPGRFPRLLPQ